MPTRHPTTVTEFYGLYTDELTRSRSTKLAYEAAELAHSGRHGKRRFKHWNSFQATRIGLGLPPGKALGQMTLLEFSRLYLSVLPNFDNMHQAYLEAERIHKERYGHRRYQRFSGFYSSYQYSFETIKYQI